MKFSPNDEFIANKGILYREWVRQSETLCPENSLYRRSGGIPEFNKVILRTVINTLCCYVGVSVTSAESEKNNFEPRYLRCLGNEKFWDSVQISGL